MAGKKRWSMEREARGDSTVAVVHAGEKGKKPCHTSQEDVNHLNHPNCTVDECMTGQDMFPSYKVRQKPLLVEGWESVGGHGRH